MKFRIADTFTDSLARLTGDEQKAVKTTAFDLQVEPKGPGMQFHRLDRAKDKNFWSVRVNSDVRLIVHLTGDSLLLCYVGHHDKAYAWAERRKLEVHPKTGAAQWVEIRETVKEIVVPVHVPAEQLVEPLSALAPTRPVAVLAGIPDEDLLGYGVPGEWLADVKAATEDSLLMLADHLPAEAAEALIVLATGGKPRVPQPAAAASPFDHPDAQRRFRVMTNVEELRKALDFPWEKWMHYLHPEQVKLVRCKFKGAARVAGAAGTGKTVVAIHRAAYLASKNRQERVLFVTLSSPLAHMVERQITKLLANDIDALDRIEVFSLRELGLRLYKAAGGRETVASDAAVRKALATASKGSSLAESFLLSEWMAVVDAFGIESREDYESFSRVGRKTRFPMSRRVNAWSCFEEMRYLLATENLVTEAGVFRKVADDLEDQGTVVSVPLWGGGPSRFKPCSLQLEDGVEIDVDFVVVDECQDLSPSQVRFLASLGGHRADSLFFAGDLGQRIFQQPFSWKSLGVDIRGRSRTLRVNYRTSHQIRTQADHLLDPVLTDVDGNSEDRSDTVSVFNGPPPRIEVLPDELAEAAAVGKWLAACAKDGILPQEIGVFVRSDAQIDRARAAVAAAGLAGMVLDQRVETATGHVAVSTMHLAKGLEFRAVAVMACDDEVIPLQERIQTVGDDADLQEVYDTERQLLYVACTRARDRLLVSAVDPASEYLDDLRGA